MNSNGAYSSINFATSLFLSSLFAQQPVSAKHKVIKIANTEKLFFCSFLFPPKIKYYFL